MLSLEDFGSPAVFSDRASADHGRRDLSCPADTAYALAQAWPDAELTLVDDSGHKGSPAFTDAIHAAVRRFSP
ncbi:hypothetical protein ACIA8G_08420 [Lentzea sp. NPDC051213]|uniref:hypothetical protein n=1 Tax=Lentzea sp. NPDC051213 TaxID=3364126 RepID=UPI00379AC43A